MKIFIPGISALVIFLELDNRNLIINGEVQSKEMYKKYKRLYESVEEAPLAPDMKYRLVL